MDHHLKALVVLSGGPAALKGFKLLHQTENSPIWCEVIDAAQEAQQDSEAVLVKDNYGNEFPRPVPLKDLSIGYGSRLLKDPLIQALLRQCIDVSLFLQADLNGTKVDPSSTQFGAGGSQAPSRLGTPNRKEPQFDPSFWEKFKIAPDGPSEEFNFDLLKEAVSQIAMRGSLTDYMEVVMQDYPDMQKSWKSKARYLLDVYKEADARTARLMAATYFFASRINYVSTGRTVQTRVPDREVPIVLMKTEAKMNEMITPWGRDLEGPLLEGLSFEAEEEESLEKSTSESPSEEVDCEADPLIPDSATEPNKFRPSLTKLCTFEEVPAIPVRAPFDYDSETLRDGVRAVLAEVDAFGQGKHELNEEADLAWLKDVKRNVLDPDQFRAGNFNETLPAWEELLKYSKRKTSKLVLGALKDGLKPSFEGTEKALDSKRKVVRAMLHQTALKREVNSFLSGKFPSRVEFSNHQSAEDNADFVWNEVKNNLASGAISAYPKGSKPKVVNPIGVVFNPKPRKILNARYINLFMKKYDFNYEKLRDILVFLRKEGFTATWDLKSGYFHVLIHPDFRTYFGFKVGEVYFHYNVVSFGYAQACYFYTVADWLGFVVDSLHELFRISEKKKLKVVAVLKQILEANDVTARMLASMAGKLVSLGPAMLPASLFSRPLFAAMQGKLSWDEVFQNPNEVKESARLFLENFDRWNGRRWHTFPVTLQTSSDASDVGFGGFVQFPGKAKLQIAGTFSQEEAALSSTAREMKGLLKTLQAALQAAGPSAIRNSCLVLTTDNRGATYAINSMRSSSPDVNKILQDFFLFSCENGVDVKAYWKPREEMQEEDALSRFPDASDWGLSSPLFQKVTAWFGVKPSVDLFASDIWHVTEKFVSKEFTPGCLAVDALNQDWRQLLKEGDWAWMFPPLRHVAQAIRLIEKFRINGILIVPRRNATNWWHVMHSWDLASPPEPVELPRSESTCDPSLRVPESVVNPAYFSLSAIKIEWRN
ncbi:putative DNA/RNA polymerases [Klebsormidium nitens]|uniref:Putative DNA/RNA polymerases n=1 Tax=Klebsormidium nitens TaxID=105231 RepID=A0A1Y1I130_KLENI|nr:putative DNA/RNA polymerases [Klebsormidium nitens]|eukprot:GAQ84615.1 putative DNA/RNA polymerases [Klebsormidium nitens]